MHLLPAELPPVLVADDSVDDQALLMSLLEKAGVPNPIFSFGDGDGLLRFLEGVCQPEVRRSMRPCLLFLDLNMPGKNGFEIARAIRENPALQHLTIVLLPGAIREEERRVANDHGIAQTLRKFPSATVFAELVGNVTAAFVRQRGASQHSKN